MKKKIKKVVAKKAPVKKKKVIVIGDKIVVNKMPENLELIPMGKKEQDFSREMFEKIASGKVAGYILLAEVEKRDERGEDLKGFTFVQHLHRNSIVKSLESALGLRLGESDPIEDLFRSIINHKPKKDGK